MYTYAAKNWIWTTNEESHKKKKNSFTCGGAETRKLIELE